MALLWSETTVLRAVLECHPAHPGNQPSFHTLWDTQ
jgi:hypothetical protein